MLEGVPNAGMRFVSETAHALSLVGTNDGTNWFALKGYCENGPDGPGGVDGLMTRIHFDFSPVGGPEDLEGIWAKHHVGEEVVTTLTWPDGNVWKQVGVSSDVIPVGAWADAKAEPPARARRSASFKLGLGTAVLIVAAAAVAVSPLLARSLRKSAEPPVMA